MGVSTYDPRQIIIALGSHIASGLADGTFLTVERNEDMWTTNVGASGEGARVKSNNKSGRYTLTLMQSSATNDILSGYAQADELSNSGKFPVIIKEIGGSTLCESTETWIVRPARVEYSKENGTREWILETHELIKFVGGQPT